MTEKELRLLRDASTLLRTYHFNRLAGQMDEAIELMEPDPDGGADGEQED